LLTEADVAVCTALVLFTFSLTVWNTDIRIIVAAVVHILQFNLVDVSFVQQTDL